MRGAAVAETAHLRLAALLMRQVARDLLFDLTQLVLQLPVQVEQAGPQRARLVRVLQVQRGRHDPQRLSQTSPVMQHTVLQVKVLRSSSNILEHDLSTTEEMIP